VLSIISAALTLAKRYKWVDSNVAEDATMPSVGRPQPNPPTPEQAARLLNLVCADDEEFGLYLCTGPASWCYVTVCGYECVDA
jgi:hypothetical protein